ncbi:MAG: Gfo/Idh/MocA family oxidoreductase [bacterium]
MSRPLGLAIVGCGRVAAKRAYALGRARLTWCVDVERARAEHIAVQVGGDVRVSTDWRDVLTARDVDAVVVATSHDGLAPIATAAAAAGKHVLVEKPAAKHVSELAALADAARATGVCVRVGYNHRFHPALLTARALVDASELGDLHYVRGRYGHGGRLGYEREWRADAERSGGGELLDQGVHLIDLARWFLGELDVAAGMTRTYFWDTPVDDNAFVLLAGERGRVAWLHSSWTEWKNTFSFEITGSLGKLEVTGLGGSYGTERLAWYRMLPTLGPPETTIWEYPGEDGSWALEMAAFVDDVAERRESVPGIADARAVLAIVERVYAGSSP